MHQRAAWNTPLIVCYSNPKGSDIQLVLRTHDASRQTTAKPYAWCYVHTIACVTARWAATSCSSYMPQVTFHHARHWQRTHHCTNTTHSSPSHVLSQWPQVAAQQPPARPLLRHQLHLYCLSRSQEHHLYCLVLMCLQLLGNLLQLIAGASHSSTKPAAMQHTAAAQGVIIIKSPIKP